MKWQSIVLILTTLISGASAQRHGGYGHQGYGGDNDGWDDRDNNNYYYQDNDSNIYTDYAARQQEKAVSGGGGGGFANTRAPKLRFKVKQKVLCHMGNNKWVKGTIVKLWGEQGPGMYAPYQVKLDTGEMIYAPADNDRTIKKAP